MTGEDVRQKGTVVGSQRALQGPESPPLTTQYVFTVEHQGQNIGGTLAATKGLVWQVEGLVGKSPQHFVW